MELEQNEYLTVDGMQTYVRLAYGCFSASGP